MSEDTIEPESSPQSDFPATDVMVAALAGTLNNSPGGRLGMTVSVNGTLISGIAVGRDAWMAEFAKSFGHGPDDAMTELSTHFTIEAMEERFPEFQENFLHLVDARYMVKVVNLPSDGGTVIRVRLDKIDSWTLLYFGPGEEGDEA